mmetsp:Transcript_21031/g.54938  ORF Transcript_21031/g.54938 Transcript_21031/m.54938 type:complete len:234 (-) Transcript_21031:247-948(-)
MSLAHASTPGQLRPLAAAPILSPFSSALPTHSWRPQGVRLPRGPVSHVSPTPAAASRPPHRSKDVPHRLAHRLDGPLGPLLQHLVDQHAGGHQLARAQHGRGHQLPHAAVPAAQPDEALIRQRVHQRALGGEAVHRVAAGPHLEVLVRRAPGAGVADAVDGDVVAQVDGRQGEQQARGGRAHPAVGLARVELHALAEAVHDGLGVAEEAVVEHRGLDVLPTLLHLGPPHAGEV